MNFLSGFASFFQHGGPFMYPILAVGITGLAISLERFWTISRASAWNGERLTRDLVDRVGRGDVRGAYDLASKVHSPVGQVAAAVLATNSSDEEKLLSTADGESAITLPPLTRRLPLIVLLANTATLMGLLGTVFGLITAFSALGAADAAQRSALLARGISQKLNSTAFGLIIAIPGLLVHGFLVARVERIVEQVDATVVKLARAMVRGPVSQPRSAGASSPVASAPSAARPAAQAAARPPANR
jgi:biopolymer transport protein ExbB/TolQ